ncbi:MAG: LysM peptidoglycan-binding domain-containing protein [Lachnospiraceae bacterium]|nr:LysM peptidoglycan-binding domain-containing protein [Lachnospiraceae bacterium]
MKHTVISFIHKHSNIIIAATIAFMFLGIFMFGSVRKAGAATHNVKYYTCINIEANDTLWSIADSYITDEYNSIDQYIAEVKSINNLSSDKIYYGATLVVPYYAAP